jgi:hypothetical protein
MRFFRIVRKTFRSSLYSQHFGCLREDGASDIPSAIRAGRFRTGQHRVGTQTHAAPVGNAVRPGRHTRRGTSIYLSLLLFGRNHNSGSDILKNRRIIQVKLFISSFLSVLFRPGRCRAGIRESARPPAGCRIEQFWTRELRAGGKRIGHFKKCRIENLSHLGACILRQASCIVNRSDRNE